MYETDKDRTKNYLTGILYKKILKALEIPTYLIDFIRIRLRNCVDEFLEEEQI